MVVALHLLLRILLLSGAREQRPGTGVRRLVERLDLVVPDEGRIGGVGTGEETCGSGIYGVGHANMRSISTTYIQSVGGMTRGAAWHKGRG